MCLDATHTRRLLEPSSDSPQDRVDVNHGPSLFTREPTAAPAQQQRDQSLLRSSRVVALDQRFHSPAHGASATGLKQSSRVSATGSQLNHTQWGQIALHIPHRQQRRAHRNFPKSKSRISLTTRSVIFSQQQHLFALRVASHRGSYLLMR
jgi:hypothetical protein